MSSEPTTAASSSSRARRPGSAPRRRSISPSKGFHVFAGVRREADGDALRAQAPERLTPLIIDVTDEATISAAAATVADAVGERGLAGLVNNAGIGKPAPIEFQPMADFRRQLEVNLFGPVAMIQAFLPLIRRGGGRIVNVGLDRRDARPAAQRRLQRVEVRDAGDQRRAPARAAPVEHPRVADRGRARRRPRSSARRTRSWTGSRRRSATTGFALYEQQIAAIRKAVEKAAADADPPLVIAKAILHALTSDKPKTRYLVGHGGKQIAVAAALPDRARDRALARELGLPKPE